jgi:hypothetical protein
MDEIPSASRLSEPDNPATTAAMVCQSVTFSSNRFTRTTSPGASSRATPRTADDSALKSVELRTSRLSPDCDDAPAGRYM